MNKEIEYSDYCVAFLDILGFKNIVRTKSANEIHDIFHGEKHAKKLITELDENDVIYGHTKMFFFSDSIVFAVPMKYPKALDCVASNCMLLQHALWSSTTPVFLRGAITIGKLYCNQGEIFGPALIKAYELESHLAINPRVILSELTYERGLENDPTKEDILYISRTDDGLRMIDMINSFRIFGESYCKLKEYIESVLSHETDHKIRSKYLWLKNHLLEQQ